MGVKYVKDFEFPRSAGFTGSADHVEGRVRVGNHMRSQPRQRFAEGGKVEKPKEAPKPPAPKGNPKVADPPKLSTLDILKGKGRKVQEDKLGLRNGGPVHQKAKYAEGGAVREPVGHSAVQRSLPTTTADAENGGKSELRPGFKTGGTVSKNRFAKGGKSRYAAGGSVGMAKGGDVAQGKKMIATAIKKHVAAPKPRGHGVKKMGGGRVNC
jgi:hypothetical protein